MKFTIATHAPHRYYEGKWYAYGPYVREMNLWLQHVTTTVIVAPVEEEEPTAIFLPYEGNVEVRPIPKFNILSLSGFLKSLFLVPGICLKLIKVFSDSDHVHLRCPGNVGLLGCMMQVFFPRKPKTAKYAGNWDPKAEQPVTYKLQRYLLKQQWLTRNMKAIVYGDWKDRSRNIIPFFTASYFDRDKLEIKKEFKPPFRLTFVGTFSVGKRPLYVIELIKELLDAKIDVHLDMFGDGELFQDAKIFSEQNRLDKYIAFHGNVSSEKVKKAYQNSHFVILPSKSEGWPKALAEGMFFGAVPIATKISCVPWMLGHGTRGILVEGDIKSDIPRLINAFSGGAALDGMSIDAMRWSQQYTLDSFDRAIKKLLTP